MFKSRCFNVAVFALSLFAFQGCSRSTHCKYCDVGVSDQSPNDIEAKDLETDSSTDIANDSPIDLCQDVVCDTPPEPECISDTLRTYRLPGTCDSKDGSCSYPYTDVLCKQGCQQGVCNLNLDPIDYLKASNAEPGDQFGFNLAMDNDTIVVSAEYEDSCATGVNGDESNNGCVDSGAAYVFVRNNGVWTQQAYLKASNTDAGDHFGYTLHIHGDTIVVGAKYEASCSRGIDGNEVDDTCARTGAAYVFVRNNGIWTQQAYLKASNADAYDLFGWGVTVHQDTVVVGATHEDSCATGANGDENSNACLQTGATYVFVRNGTTWTQEAYLKASNPGENDSFGFNLSMSNNTLVIGARGEASCGSSPLDDGCTEAGAAYVFVRKGTTWTQEAYLKADYPGAYDLYGDDVSIYEDTIVVGAVFEQSCTKGINGNEQDNSCGRAGAAYVYTRNAGVWTKEAYIKASNTNSNDRYGNEISIYKDRLLVASDQEASCSVGIHSNELDNACTGAGAAFFYTREAGSWTKKAYIKADFPETADEFSNAVSVYEDTLVIGAPFEDSCAKGINGDISANGCDDSGAVYVYVVDQS